MNYASKFDGKSFIDGIGAHANGHAPGDSISPHTTHAPADAIIVPDAHLLFNGDFKRSGVDLILSADDQKLVLHDYFKGEKRVALASPDGAHLTGDIVKALAGHVEYAQAADGSASVNKVIGHVTKLAGTATAIRNGVSITLNQGDNVEKGDVVQSGAGSTLGITFIDGTVFGLSSNARMVLNEMVYDPNGSNNSSLLSLVAGTITFVAGETAKHGDMKIDTPVATMGIRGTAVLVEIDFDTAGQNGLPDTKFQVLVEPDGTTGSYILFDKVTLTPFAIVDKAGTQFSFSNGNFSQSLTGLTPEVQKLITDVFAQKFSDNTNPRTFDHHSDFSALDTLPQFKVGSITVTPVILVVNTPAAISTPTSNGPTSQIQHIDGAPGGVIVNADGQASTDFKITEIPGVTGSTTPDQVSGKVNFVDINAGDQPTVSAKFDGSTYTDPHGIALSLNAQQLADIKAVEVDLAVTQTPGNNNNGSASWSYTVPDGSFDFLAAGETLQLTYTLTVDNNYAPNDEKTDLKFTITITGTNDVPVITTGAQTINFIAGKGTVGGDLAPTSETSGVNVNHPTALSYSEKGTLAFTDPDLTDTHTIVSTGLNGDLTAASLSGTTLDLAALAAKYPGPFQTFESALTASIGTDSTGTGTGTINWSFAELPAFVADFIASGQILTLTYTVEVQDSQGAISTQTITVTITGNDNPAVVWKDVAPAPPSGALWSDGSNWGTGNAPTISDDTIIITNQLQPHAPTYPVVINSAAAAKTLLMDDPTGLLAPELDNHNTLTIAGGLNMSADAILKNFGDISVGTLATLLAIGGLAEFSNHSVLNNSGTIELAQGGDFLDQSSITNSGTIEVVADTLNVAVAIANAGGIIQVDDGAELKLHGAIHGGTINNGTASGTVVASGTVFGNIDVIANSKIDSNAILNHGDVTIESGVILTLDNVTVNGTTFIDTAGGAIIQVDDGTTLTLNGATINGGTVNDGTAGGTVVASGTVLGNIDITGDSKISGASLNHGDVTVDAKLTLDNVTVTGTTFTDTASGAIIQVDDGTTLTLSGVTIDGGAFDDGTLVGGLVASTGLIDVTGNTKIDSNASLNNGYVTIESGKILTLDNVTVTGTEFTDTASGVIVQIDNGATLTMSGVTIDGGTINDGTVVGGLVASTGLIDVTGNSKIDSNASLNNGYVTIESGVILTLDNVTVNGTTFTDTASGAIIQVDDGTTLTLNGAAINGGTINDGTAGGTVVASGTVIGNIYVTGNSKIDSNTILNHGNVTIESGVILTLDNVTVNGTTFTDTASGAIIQVDDGTTLTLNGVTVHGGTINDGTANGTGSPAVFGSIVVTGDSTISNADLNNGSITTDQGISLTLTNDTVTGTSIVVDGVVNTPTPGNLTLQGGTTLNGSDLTIDNADLVTLNGATITGGTISGSGTIDVTDSSKINGNANVGNAGVTIESGVILTLDNVTVTGTEFTDTASGAVIQIDDGTTLTLSGVTIDGGTINDGTVVGGLVASTGLIDVTGNTKIDSNASLNNGYVTIESGKILTLDNVTVNGTTFTDTASGAIVQVDDGTTLTLNGVTIDGGTINDGTVVGGLVASTGLIDVAGNAKIDSNASLNNGYVTIESGKVLTLDNVTVTGTTFTDTASGAIIQVDDGTTLTLSGVTIDGGTINDGTLVGGVVASTGLIDVTGNTKIDSNASLNNGYVTIESGKTLTLDNVTATGSTFTDTASGATLSVDINDALTLEAGVVISGGTLANSGTLKIESATGATLDGVAVTGSGVVQVDGSNGGGGGSPPPQPATLVLDDGTSMTGGTLSIGPVGTADVEYGSNGPLHGATFDGVTVNNKSGGTFEVGHASASGAIIALFDDGTAINGGTLTIGAFGTVDVEYGANSPLHGAIFDGATVDNSSGGTFEVGEASASGTVIALFEDGAAVSNGTLTIGGFGAVDVEYGSNGPSHGATFNHVTVNISSGGAFEVGETSASGTIVAILEGGTSINDGALTIGSGGALEVETAAGATLNNVQVTNHNSIEVVSGSVLTLDGGTNITNSGATITVDSGGTLVLNGATITGGTVTDNGTIDVTGAATLAGVTISGAAPGTGIIDNTGAVTIGSGGLTLAGSGYTLELNGSGTMLLNGKTIKSTFAGTGGDTLINNGNTISGFGQIGTGSDGTKPLIVNNESGTIEAVGGILQISNGASFTNSGLLEAANTGTLDVTIGNIHNNGTNPLASSNASGILVDGTLEIDNPITSNAAGSLSLGGNGHGVVALAGGTIEGNSSNAETLFNVNNTITGYGNIGVSTDLLTLQNDLAGIIDANVSGQIVSIDTVATSNAGLIEATNGGAVDFANTITNTNNITASGGGKIAFGNETIVNTGTIHVDGSVTASQMIIHGTVTLESATGTPTGTGSGEVILTGGSLDAILSDLNPATLVNVDNTISGSGALGDADLTVQNDQYGVIDATGVLALNAGNITNIGLLEATSGGTLQIENSINNSGTIEANGGTVYVAAGATITGTPTVTITGGGLAEFAGSAAQTLLLNATFSGSGGMLQLDNAQHYGGTISGFGAGDKIDLVDLAYSSTETDVWNSATHTLTITSGTQIETLHFTATDNFSQNDFAITSDANGHTELVSNAGGSLTQPQVTMTGLDSAGNAVAGDSVTANFSSPGNGNPGLVTYTWLENGQVDSAVTGDTFTPSALDAGKVIDVVVGFDTGNEQMTALAGTVATPPAVSFNLAGVATTNFNTPLTLNSLNLSFADAGGDSFTVTLHADHGTLSLTNAGTLTEGGTGGTLTLTGTLSDIDTALGHGLVYTPTTGYAGSDAISLSALDGAFSSNTATLDIDVIGDPVITPAPDQTIGVNATTKIPGTSLAETGNIAGETFTVTASDVHGQLSATATGDGDTVTITSGTLVTITGSLSDVNADLATLTDTNGTLGSDPITLTAADSFGNSSATMQTIAVTVVPPPTANNEAYSILGSSQSTSSTIIFDDSASDPFTVTAISNETTTVTATDSNGALELAGAYGELFVFPAAVTDVTIGAFVGHDFIAGDLVYVPNSDPLLAPGQTEIDSFTYTITDSVTGISSSATATFTLSDSDIYTGPNGGSWADDTNWMFNVPGSIINTAYIGLNATAVLDTTASGIALSLGSGATLDIETGTTGAGATLDGVTVTGTDTSTDAGTTASTIEVGVSGAATLILDDDTTITGGNLTIGNDGTLEIVLGQNDGNATLDGVAVSNYGAIQIGSTIVGDPTLTLDDGTTVTGGKLLIGAGDNLDIEAGAINGHGSTLHNVEVDSTDFTSTITVASGSTLTLNTATIDGGTINDYGNIDISGSSALKNGVDLNGGNVEIEAGQTLTLDGVTVSGTTITFAGSGDTLVVDQESSLDGTSIAGMTVGDAIDLGGIGAANNYSFDGTTLTLKNGTTVLETLSLSGLAADTNFDLVSDNNGGTIITETPTITIEVVTPNGLDFRQHNALTEMGFGTIQPGGTSTSFTIVDTADNLKFVLDGFNFSYGVDGATLTGGTLTSFHEFTNDSTPVALANFTGQFVDIVTWMTDVQLAAAGNSGPIDALNSAISYNFIGGSGPDTFGSGGHADTLSGTGADFFDGGGAPIGSHDTETGGAGSTFVFAQGYGALTITNFDQDSNGNFSQSIGDHVQLDGFSGHPTVTYVNGNTIADFGNGDVLTLLHVDPANLVDSDFIGGGNGNNGGGNGNNSGGPIVSNAGNTVTYTGTAVTLDPSIAVSDATGTVTSVNAWISAGAETGDALMIKGQTTGDLTDPDGTIHYHFDGNAISLTETSGSPTLADFDAALQLIEFTPGAVDGARTITWAAQDSASATSPTVTTTVNVGPSLNSFTLTIGEGGTTVLTNSDFSVSDPGFSNFTYSVQNVTGGQFEVFNGTNWVAATTGGFTTAQIAAGQVEFVQDGSDAAPTFSIQVGDGSNVSPAIAPTIHFYDAPVVNTANITLSSNSLSSGFDTEHQGAAVTYADGHLYLNFNNGAETGSTSDNASILGFNTGPNGSSGSVVSYAWNDGDFLGLAADGNQIYAAGESYPGFGLTSDTVGGVETKAILARFAADGTAGSDPSPALGTTAHTFYGYSGVESFQNVLATTQNGNTIVYAFGFGQPASYDGYVIGEYDSNGTLLHSATDPLPVPGYSNMLDAVDFNGAIWAVGTSSHASLGESAGIPTVWTASNDLSSIVTHEDTVGSVTGSFNGAAVVGSSLLAVGSTYGGDYLVASYNTDGSVAWSETFSDGGADIFNSAVAVNGELYVVGSTTSGGSTEGVLMEIDPSNGHVISTVTYDPEQYNSLTSITTDGQHLYIADVSGSSATQNAAFLLTYDVGGPTATTNEDTAVNLQSLAVSDLAAGSSQIEVTLAAGHGTVTLVNANGLDSEVGNGTGTLELFGTQAEINTALATGVVYDPASNYTGPDTLTVTANDLGHNASGVAQSTSQSVGIGITSADVIADGATHTVSAPTGDTILFATGNGTLDFTQPSTFSGEIAGISGTGDVLDIAGFSALTTTASTTDNYNSTFNTTTLTVTDASNAHVETFTLAGNLSNSTWMVTDDHNGGVDIVDPPAATPATATIAATSPNQTLTGNAVSDTFVFNFANVGQASVSNFHAATDTLQFNSQLFANVQAALNATHDDGHGNTVITLDAHDAITLSGVVKAQLHASDFHFA